jgi:hypothetical protein
MRLLMKERQSVTRVTAQRYKKGRKKDRSGILDEFVHLTGYTRKYASYVLRMQGKRIWIRDNVVVQADRRSKRKRKRKRVYDEEVLRVLRKIWVIMNYMCGKRLAAILKEIIPKLEEHGEIEVREETREKLLRISASTIDRVLCRERKKLRLKSRSRTKPGTLLKHQIPIRTFSEWDEGRPGFIEMDLVGHEGGDATGEYIQSLNCVDVCSGWTETFAVRNKAQVWVFEGIQDMKARLPFDLLGIDSDNGAEFINAQLLRYCQSEGITFTRSRAYRKNDSCHVEQKNYTAVRQYAGYLRYDTEEELELLNGLYRHLSLYLNYFHPVMKLKTKERIGSRVKKVYEAARTPYQRILESSEVPEKNKEKLKQTYAQLNPAELRRKIQKLQRRLLKIATTKNERSRKGVLIKTQRADYKATEAIV